jgi:hypothetical protein
MRSSFRECAAVLSLMLTMALPAPSEAGDPVDPDAAAVAEASAHFEEGKTRYETSDYVGAVEAFTQAYQAAGRVDDEGKRDNALSALLYNLASAHVKARNVDGDDRHLRQAQELLQRAIDSGFDGAGACRKLLDEVEAELAAVDEAEAEPAALEAEAEPAAHDTDLQSSAPQDIPTAPDDGHDPGRPLVITGGVITGLGVGSLGLMGAGLGLASSAEADFAAGPTRDDRDDALAKGKRSNAMVIAGGVAGGVLIATGVALIIVGKRRSSSKLAVAPTATPTVAGLSLRGRF